MKKSGLIKLIASAAAAVFAFSLAGCSAGIAAGGEVREYSVTIAQTEGGAELSSAEVLEKIRPTVVDVTSSSETAVSAGSGVIIGGAVGSGAGSEYFIVTNHHVIDGGSSFTVDVLDIADDGTETTTAYSALLVGGSQKRDIAVLSVTVPAGVTLKTAAFIADSDKVRVGTEVYAIGNPLGILGGSVTHGIVSATKRDVNVGGIGTMTLMQTDALINGGNSGGGLFDTSGALVGIINSGYDTYNDMQVEGLNFAIPANDAKYAATSLINTHEGQGGTVTKYGYVEGDARLDVTFSTATLYTDASLSGRAVCLVAAASGTESPLYPSWTNGVKAVTAITVNGTRHDLSVSSGGSYALTQEANKIISAVRAGDGVTVEYRDVLSRQIGFISSYNYLGSELKTASFTAEQYIYEP